MKIFSWDPFGMIEEDKPSDGFYITYQDHIAALEANQQEVINLLEWIEDYALADSDLGEIASRATKAINLIKKEHNNGTDSH